ncbi:nuclear transport factor 2 family protein [Pantoea ananatis]|uniref:nuclear transport factor 2 family protein n=1 Tax=Pantoea ananas TaxID=553 RepID=UPI0024ADBC13|nr:nuclear transport factor 2 family protein [Pantoea ananatis]MDI6539872.1 nuclear transport factor 2 family protein [Pantoea ananatis]
MKDLTEILINALHEIVEEQWHDPVRVACYFDKSYMQWVDGKNLGYDEFVDHIAFLKSHTKSMKVNVLATAEEQNTVFTQHQVLVEKSTGEESLIEVFARFVFAEGKIIRCEELTRQLKGDPSDRDLGSRL